MPVTNDNQEKTPFAKYGLFVSSTYGGSYKLNRRAVIQNFRTQLRGLGSCGVSLLPKDQVNEQINQTLKEGNFVKILDCTKYFEEEYTSTGDELFFGTITSVTSDVYQAKDDDRGYVQIDEIGHYFSKIPIVWSSKPQVFNPIVAGVAYGNKKEDELQFETILDNMTKVELNGSDSAKFSNTNTATQGEGNKKVWTLESFLLYMAEKHNVDIKFPWEFDADIIDKQVDKANQGLDPNDPIDAAKINANDAAGTANKQLIAYQYRAFKDSLEVKSFDHYDGKSFQELLESVIDEPFDWYFSSISTSYPTIQIINKSPVLAYDFCPSAQLIQKSIDDDITTNFNITKQDEVYGKVIYRGDNILVAGSLSHWNNNGSASMQELWTGTEEQEYISPSFTGSFDAETKKAIVAIERSKNKKVYQQYKFKHIGQSCPIQLAKKYDEKTKKFSQAPMLPDDNGQAQYQMVPFFPQIDFTKFENGSTYVLPKPKVYDSLGLHKSPPILEMKWSDTLPWKVDGQKEVRKPFITTQTFGTDSDSINRFQIYDLTKAGGGYDTASFTHTVDGYKIEIQLPETLAWQDPEQIIFTLGNTIVDAAGDYWSTDSVSDRNPKTTDYKFKTNWKMMCATVAGFSDQRLEWVESNPDTSIGANKVKIIEDRSLQCWFAHAGTIKEVRNGPYDVVAPGSLPRNYVNGYDRFQKDTFIRNDFKKLYTLCKHTANWLFTPKASAKIELALMKYNGGWNLGEVVGEIIDGKIKRKINTAVASIEYDCVSNRIYVSTSMPEMPALKKLQMSSSPSRSVISPSSNSKDATIEKVEKVIETKQYPTHGYVSGGGAIGAAGTESYKVLQILYGQEVAGFNCIKHIEEIPTSITPSISANQLSFTQEGIGSANLFIDGVKEDLPVFVVNRNELHPHMLLSGQVVTTYQTVTITGDNGFTGTFYLPSGM